MGYKEGTVLGKSTQGQSKLLDDYKQEHSLKDEKPAVQQNISQPESGYSDFAQRQMVWYTQGGWQRDFPWRVMSRGQKLVCDSWKATKKTYVIH